MLLLLLLLAGGRDVGYPGRLDLFQGQGLALVEFGVQGLETGEAVDLCRHDGRACGGGGREGEEELEG